MTRGERATALYRRLLSLYPPDHRDEYGDAMVQLFADRYRHERPAGDVFRFVRFWGGIVGDAIRTALAERTESVMSNVKQRWWLWTIGLIAGLQTVFLVEHAIGFAVGGLGSDHRTSKIAVVTTLTITTAALVAGLRTIDRRPRRGGALLAIGLIPVAVSGMVFFWFPPMYLMSALGIYLIVRALMEAGRLTRSDPAIA